MFLYVTKIQKKGRLFMTNISMTNMSAEDQQDHTINRRFKDTLFRKIFKEKEALLSLYNAVNRSDYTNPEDIIINTLEDVIYIGMKNDVSFLFSGVMNLYEHQSTVNLNMPLRGLFYFSKIYQNYVKDDKRFLYGRKRIPLPLPCYVVFYNGIEKEPECRELRLSDAFIRTDRMDGEAAPALECVVKVLNINAGHNRELVERCQLLAHYAEFVRLVREHLDKGMRIGEAVDQTVDICIQKGILKEFLEKNRMEVTEMLLTEYNREKHIECVREEGMEKGFEDGQKVGFADGQMAGKADSLIKLLSARHQLTEELRLEIMEQKDAEILEQWFDLALASDSLEEFLRKIGKNVCRKDGRETFLQSKEKGADHADYRENHPSTDGNKIFEC